MTQIIQNFLSEFFGAPIVVFLLSLLPISEIRGGLIAARLMGVELIPAFLIGYVGNMLPIPLILLFLKRVFAWLRRFKRFDRILDRLQSRAEEKSKSLERGQMLGLFILVAIPLPGTGAWTGALVADFLGIRFRRALPVIAAGVLAAGIIVATLMYFVPSLFGV